MKIYTGMWIAYKKNLTALETKYANYFFTKTSDDEARGFLIGEALSVCQKCDGWENHSCSFTEIPLSVIAQTLDLMRDHG